MTENIKVVVRVRPALGDEAQGGEAHAVQLAERRPRAARRALRCAACASTAATARPSRAASTRCSTRREPADVFEELRPAVAGVARA